MTISTRSDAHSAATETANRDRRAPRRRASDRFHTGIPVHHVAPPPAARPTEWRLDDFLSDGAPVAFGGLAAVEAARGFSAGNGYLAGLIVDRSR